MSDSWKKSKKYRTTEDKLHNKEFLERKRWELEQQEWQEQLNLRAYLKDKGIEE